jgi:hypothetical protein
MTKCKVIEIGERSRRGRTGVLRNFPQKSRDLSRAVWCFISHLLNRHERKQHRQVLQFPRRLNSEIITEQQKGNNS